MQFVLDHQNREDERFIDELEVLVSSHFDELELSRLHSSLHETGTYNLFNACMALLNKYRGFPKGKIPFELDLQDYVYADKIIRKMES